MTPRIDAGWLVVPCDATDMAQVHIAVGVKEPGAWHPAFRDWDAAGTRVAKIRPPTTGTLSVWINVDGNVTRIRGTVTL